MRNRIINLGVVAEIAQALGDLNQSVVFVGGAVIGLYADDPAADEVRPTQDVDLTLKLLDFNQRELDTKLAEREFYPDIQGHTICTYKYNDIAVDIMASTDSMRGPTNRWYSIGFDSIQQIQFEGVLIQILSAACYLATKFEAYNHRGNGDYRTSHDFEDIIYVIDNRTTIVEEVRVLVWNTHSHLRPTPALHGRQTNSRFILLDSTDRRSLDVDIHVVFILPIMNRSRGAVGHMLQVY